MAFNGLAEVPIGAKRSRDAIVIPKYLTLIFTSDIIHIPKPLIGKEDVAAVGEPVAEETKNLEAALNLKSE